MIDQTFVGLFSTTGGDRMGGLGKAIVIGVAMLGFVVSPRASGGDKPSDKVRGRV